DLTGANFSDADLQDANFSRANLSGAQLTRANLAGANLREATLRDTVLTNAHLAKANLEMAQLINTDFSNATVNDCRIYGMSAWDVRTEGATQQGLIITPEDQPTVRVDDLTVGQVLYLFLHNPNIRHLLNAATSKIILILGRFAPPHLEVLQSLRKE